MQVQMLLPPAELGCTHTLMLRCPGPSPAGALKGTPGQVLLDHLADGSGKSRVLLVRAGAHTQAHFGMQDLSPVGGLQDLASGSLSAEREEFPLSLSVFEPSAKGLRWKFNDA